MTQTRTAFKVAKPIPVKKPPMPETLPPWAGVDETATLLNLSSKFVRAEIRAGRCPHIKSGNRFLVDVVGFNAILRAQAARGVSA